MNTRALLCCRCGGPLANPDVLSANVDCLYCGTVNSPAGAAVLVAWEVRKNAIAKFTETLVEALNAGNSAYDALCASSAAHLGIAGSTDTVARITLALAHDFEQQSGVSVVRDPKALSRIAQAYLLALEELATSESYDLNLPFLAVSELGPVHLRRTLTAPLLAELAQRDPPVAPSKPEASAPVTETKKKGWWPFS